MQLKNKLIKKCRECTSREKVHFYLSEEMAKKIRKLDNEYCKKFKKIDAYNSLFRLPCLHSRKNPFSRRNRFRHNGITENKLREKSFISKLARVAVRALKKQEPKNENFEKKFYRSHTLIEKTFKSNKFTYYFLKNLKNFSIENEYLTYSNKINEQFYEEPEELEDNMDIYLRILVTINFN